ncbi:hypothetical protein SCG7086_AE_00330 [Chlamydiales bacterium SCGC AG-110-P3]|nr:hypothetical protein SCG7086_AE_00330 [Chlamydiales bacterium SCGC AG-110-P3]
MCRDPFEKQRAVSLIFLGGTQYADTYFNRDPLFVFFVGKYGRGPDSSTFR